MDTVVKTNVLYKVAAHSDDSDFDNTWSALEASFRQIHTKETSAISFEELYRGAYRLVLKKKGEQLYKEVVDFERKWLQQTVQEQVKALLSQELLQTNTSASVVERRFAGEKFLKAVKQQWNDHDSCMVMLSDVLLYLVCIISGNHRAR
jgi:cullin 3